MTLFQHEQFVSGQALFVDGYEQILLIQNSVGRSNSCSTTNFTYSGGRYWCYHSGIRTRSLLGCVTLVGGYQDYLFSKNGAKTTILTIKIRFYMLEILLHQTLLSSILLGSCVSSWFHSRSMHLLAISHSFKLIVIEMTKPQFDSFS